MAYADLTIDQGTDFNTTLDILDDDGTTVNVAGYVFSGQIRKSYYSSSPTANLSVSSTDTSNGVVRISLSSAYTSNIAAGRYVYDVKMVNNANTVSRILEGIVTVTPQVTR